MTTYPYDADLKTFCKRIGWKVYPNQSRRRGVPKAIVDLWHGGSDHPILLYRGDYLRSPDAYALLSQEYTGGKPVPHSHSDSLTAQPLGLAPYGCETQAFLYVAA